MPMLLLMKQKVIIIIINQQGQITQIYLTLQASSLLAKHIPSRGGVHWTPPQDFCYAWADRLEIWHEC